MTLSAAKIDEIFDRYPAQPEYLIFILQDIQAKFGYISADDMQLTCDHTGVPLTQAYSVATFYQSFKLEPQGEHDIRVCCGTACHLKGGKRIVEELSRKLETAPGETSPDMRVSLNTVNCLGACALSPVVVVDEEYHPNMTAEKVEKILRNLN